MKNIAIIFFSIIAISIIFCTFIFFVNKSYFAEFISLTIALLLAIILLLFSKPKSIVYKLPRKITFDFDKNVVMCKIETNNKPRFNKISSIKKIYDYGDWYYIRFKFDPSNYLVCQKDLIVKGTIGEFEKIFKDKIIKKC